MTTATIRRDYRASLILDLRGSTDAPETVIDKLKEVLKSIDCKVNEVENLGHERVDVHCCWLRGRRLAEGEQAADLLLDHVELPTGDGEAVIDTAAWIGPGAAPAVEIDRKPGASDRVAEFVGESRRKLAEEPLSFTGDETRPERLQFAAHPLDARGDAAHLVIVGLGGRGPELAR
jgi:hypothetical protein